jgi:hypothetical protein
VSRHFAHAIVFTLAAACASAPTAHATQFLSAIEDVPLARGLVETPEPMIFESEQGRVVRVSAEGAVRAEDVAAFYAQTLPALGWRPAQDGAYLRENERLTLRIRAAADTAPVRVEFELVVKLASTRLPD